VLAQREIEARRRPHPPRHVGPIPSGPLASQERRGLPAETEPPHV
jgi:hypothetical protein